MAATPKDVVGFWTAAGPEKWFKKNPKFDHSIALKFEPVHHAAARGEYDAWMASAEGSLALLILLLLITYVPATVTWLPDFLGL